MKKNLLLLALFLSASLSYSFAQNTLDMLPSLSASGDNSSYDQGSKTITFSADGWTSDIGWWYSDQVGQGQDFSLYKNLVVDFEQAVDFTITLNVEYNNGATSSVATADPGATSVFVPLDATGKTDVKYIYLKAENAGSLTLKDAYMTDSEGGVSAEIISDFSQLPDGSDTGNPTQHPGWLVNGIMDEMAKAKYLVVETNGVGDNPNGFGGIQFDFQGNDGDAGTVSVGLPDWVQVNLNGDWVSYPRADGKTVSIAIDLGSVFGDQLSDFLKCTSWARIILAYYGGTSAFNGLGVTNVYLTGDFTKPAVATDLTGSSGTEYYGFIFDGAISGITGIPQVKQALSNVYGVEGGIIVNAANEKVSVYGIDGRLVKQTVIDEYGSTIPLSQGIYIVKVGSAKPVKVIAQ